MNTSIRAFVVAPLAALALSACVAKIGENVDITHGPPAADIKTPYETKLACLKSEMMTQNKAPRFVAVGEIADRTGRSQYLEEETLPVTAGAGDMLSSALVQYQIAYLAERLDTRILQFELNQAQKRILGDGEKTTIQTAEGPKQVDYRAIPVGSLQGSEMYIVGSISSLDWLSSAGGDVSIAGIGPRARQGRALVGIDLRVIDTTSGMVMAARSMNRQLVFEEAGFGIARVFGSGGGATLVNLDIGGQRSVPLNYSLRSMLHLAAFELFAQVYAIDVTNCREDTTEPADQSATS